MAKKTLTISRVEKKTEQAPAEEQFFEIGEKKYRVTKSAHIRLGSGMQILTPADIAVNTEAQKYLVEHGCSCVEEVV